MLLFPPIRMFGLSTVATHLAWSKMRLAKTGEMSSWAGLLQCLGYWNVRAVAVDRYLIFGRPSCLRILANQHVETA